MNKQNKTERPTRLLWPKSDNWVIGLSNWFVIHPCWLDKQCQTFEAPPRLYINTKYGTLIVSRIEGEKTFKGYRPRKRKE